MTFSDKTLAQTITQLCLIKGIDHVVISPGSRSAPLTISFTQDPGFSCFSVVDERCAGFTALGMAQALGRPVALVCTSGSALLNYYPAISEAFYSDIPLVVISADRPADRIDIGDGQTIRQEGVYAHHILYSAHCREGVDAQLFNETAINVALNSAIELKGPVHINAPFDEPLYGVVKDLQVRPQHVPARLPVDEFGDAFHKLVKSWNKAKRKLVLVGVLPPGTLSPEILDRLLSDPSVLMMTETTSNLHHHRMVHAIDQLIAPLEDEQLDELQPDLLLTIGGMIVSKKIKALLRAYAPEHHFHIDPKKAYDTFFVLDGHIKARASSGLNKLLEQAEVGIGDYQSKWLHLCKYRRQGHDEFMEQAPYSDLLVYRDLLSGLPPHVHLHLANSTAIRYAQLFPIADDVSVYCNRGTSGIDGSSSTAVGMSMVSDRPVVLITGDLSFFYDSNAYWNAHIPSSFRVIVVNNSGGGIFRILPKAKETDQFEKFFETQHQLTAKPLCELFGLEYVSSEDTRQLQGVLTDFYGDSDRPKLLEIFTPSAVNDVVLSEYFKFLK
jgi:2-succinyl-5-enolpyruvyl-6-hydroxy-3-cyclohexene-1-carboxylate synthase